MEFTKSLTSDQVTTIQSMMTAEKFNGTMSGFISARIDTWIKAQDEFIARNAKKSLQDKIISATQNASLVDLQTLVTAADSLESVKVNNIEVDNVVKL